VHKYGGLGYVGFAEEGRKAGEGNSAFAFDYIIVCVGQRGPPRPAWWSALPAQGRAERVIGIDASGTPQQTRARRVRQIVGNTAELVGLGRSVREDKIIINPDYAYPAYGVPSEETNQAIRLAAPPRRR